MEDDKINFVKTKKEDIRAEVRRMERHSGKSKIRNLQQ